MTLLDSALAYAARGWPVFPVQPPVPGDDKSGKKPFPGSHGFQEATTNPNWVERWWDRWPDANVALATGKALRAWVLDVDGEEGARSLTQLEEELGVLPDTLDAQTGGGGRHLYFAWPEGREIKNKQNLRPGIDVRGEGGYVVAPPSKHYTGRDYLWTVDDKQPIVHAPKAWLDFVAPPKAPAPAPWDRVPPPEAPSSAPAPIFNGGKMPLLERARLYLREVDPAVQGSGGHNALLWAARCLVVGFELDAETALQLLWSDYNPRCVPPWNPESPTERKDFERKAAQAKDTPPGKRPGWLLDEFGLRGANEHARLLGETSAAALLASAKKRAEIAPETIVAPAVPLAVQPKDPGERRPFPVEHFPAPIRDYCLSLSESHGVDSSFVALPALAVAGAAMGNAWRLEAKPTWRLAPILWVALVAAPGRNKTGPLEAVMEVLRRRIPAEAIPNPILNPQAPILVQDATLEAVLVLMAESRRGLLSYNDELAAWIEGFGKGGKGKKGGRGDESAWLQFWNGKPYSLHRKTNNERIAIPAASACVVGGIQPKVLQQLFEPGRFDSGFVSRFLIACPPFRTKFWTDNYVDPTCEDRWSDAIMWLRCTPFVGMDTDNDGAMIPRVVSLGEGEAKSIFKDFYDSTELEQEEGGLDDNARSFLSKSQTQAARLTLIHHGLRLACGDRSSFDAPVAVESVKAGVAWARWCLEEQFRAYGYGVTTGLKQNADALLEAIRARCPTRSATTHQVMRLNGRRWQPKARAVAAMGMLVEQGHARWADEKRNKVILNEEVKV